LKSAGPSVKLCEGGIEMNVIIADITTLSADAIVNARATPLGNGARSIAFPCISTGTYGYPKELAARVAVAAVRDFLDHHPGAIDVTFCCFSRDEYEIYAELLHE
jgi:O-acetyl-ADP-ribose deacetylase (regulator of RNase III)